MEKDITTYINKHTEKEIKAQPRLWNETFSLLVETKKDIALFLSPILQLKDLRIILTGAGSSAFVGEVAQGTIQQQTNLPTQLVATTDLVTHPEAFFIKQRPTLLISFARSGNSPESLEAASLLDQHCDNAYHLIITCNPEGKLANFDTKNPLYSIQLPEETNDKSLAMTSSFTAMLLTALLVFDIDNIESKQQAVTNMIAIGEDLLKAEDVFKEIAKSNFERVVFLGSGPMVGIARECHLKLQELTDGQVICKHDSFLGFRHGPRAVVNANTLVVYLFSNDPHVFRYEKDLAEDIARDARKIQSLTITDEPTLELENSKHIVTSAFKHSDNLNAVPTTLVGQLLGLHKSLTLGLDPDNPSVSGAINRVVQGVTIYKRKEK
ncbi:tagatose-6-phosphate ketose/aldose isomerase [Galbibacter marinus]|uniref:Tagatose-6-phosphate ketose/aldose isomerase n=1 Tax=Galbibacter marinus TaxID=555500 RepID=K2QKI3_9FLAO|nr:SIS domain-containing protein [Galbibacter marinus]EKF55212.1 tagatose-6-phosphate ketose/aldose isomerase [Galbibacter marinus]